MYGTGMNIYSTPFNNETRLCTGPSVDSGFTDFKQLVSVMGDPDIWDGKYLAIYGTGKDRVLFSNIKFCIDGVDNIGYGDENTEAGGDES